MYKLHIYSNCKHWKITKNTGEKKLFIITLIREILVDVLTSFYMLFYNVEIILNLQFWIFLNLLSQVNKIYWWTKYLVAIF